MVKPRPKVLGQLLLEMGAVSEDQLEDALNRQTGSGERLGALLVTVGATDEETVARCLSLQLNLPYEAPPLRPEDSALRTVLPELARRGRVLPLTATHRSLRLAMGDPLDLGVLDDVQFQCGRRVEPVVASPSAVLEGIARGYGGEFQNLLKELPAEWRKPDEREDEEEEVSSLERAARSAPVVKLVDHILDRGVKEGASDIHIEGQEGEIQVRYRLDGVLRQVMGLPSDSHEAVVSRLKIMAGMDISVKRKPQDGGLPLRNGGPGLTLRVSTLPVQEGEKTVIRILDPRKAPRSLGDLGLSADDLARFRGLMGGSQGVILAAGPTGSGKSSTLFAALAELDRKGRNLVTLEDPVEYRLPGANQVQVNPKAGLTFPAALRSVLRQDPDIIMVGEIRDRETAEIAMAAAVTGHLVFSTIHTVDAPGAITRLLNMGVPPYLLAGGLAGVVAQRLVRRLCKKCGGRTQEGCKACHDGYRGRTGVFQLLTMTDSLREDVAQGASLGRLRRSALEGGMGTLKEDALRKLAEGTTSPHEVSRILQGDMGTYLPCPDCGGDVPTGSRGCPWCGAARAHVCACGNEIRHEWRFCPGCLRKVSVPR
ncbi:MAG: ATPase, T2SS/T4P/T4SS family [Longimicrobiales bacterium]